MMNAKRLAQYLAGEAMDADVSSLRNDLAEHKKECEAKPGNCPKEKALRQEIEKVEGSKDEADNGVSSPSGDGKGEGFSAEPELNLTDEEFKELDGLIDEYDRGYDDYVDNMMAENGGDGGREWVAEEVTNEMNRASEAIQSNDWKYLKTGEWEFTDMDTLYGIGCLIQKGLGLSDAEDASLAKKYLGMCEDESLAEHDKRYHGGHYDPEKQSCGLREEGENGDDGEVSFPIRDLRRGWNRDKNEKEYLEKLKVLAKNAVQAREKADNAGTIYGPDWKAQSIADSTANAFLTAYEKRGDYLMFPSEAWNKMEEIYKSLFPSK